MVSREELHARPVATRMREPRVTRHERHIERLGEGQECRVVHRHGVAQRPHPVRQGRMRIADDREVGEVVTGLLGPMGLQDPCADHATQGMEELDIDEMGSVQVAIAPEPLGQPRQQGSSSQDTDDGRGVDDDHARSRPTRMASMMTSMSAPAVRELARKITSATGGRSARRVRSVSR